MKIEATRAMLGKQVTVLIDEYVTITGQLLAFGDGGDFHIRDETGFVHYCWPLLEIKEILGGDAGGSEHGSHDPSRVSDGTADPSSELLTADELMAIDLCGDLANALGKIVGDEFHGDCEEMVHHVHILQAMVMSNAAARAYPKEFRLLGETFKPS